MSIRISTIGDGAMATVCSIIAASRGAQVTLWGRRPEHIAQLQADRENKRYLPGIKIPDAITFTSDPARAFANADLLLCAVPTQYMRPVLESLKPALLAHAPKTPAVSISKGIENNTLLRPTEIITAVLGPRAVAALSGPSIAGEMARSLPTTMVIASENNALAQLIQDAFTTRALRLYRNSDVIGVELAGALKNVVAVAAGILDGLRVGNNAKAALLTRGLVEITRLGLALGADAETFAGLAGLGDLVTTCFSPEGRNRSFGEKVGRGGKPADVLAAMVGVVEGVPTTQSVVSLARHLNVEMPISESLYQVLFEGKDPIAGIADLMSREPKSEAVWSQSDDENDENHPSPPSDNPS